MQKRKKYVATCDDGKEFFEIEYFSEHRGGSEGNKADAVKTAEALGYRDFRICRANRYKF